MFSPFELTHGQPGVLRFPGVVARVAHTVLPTELGDRRAGLSFLQYLDDLFLGVLLPLRGVLPFALF